MSHFFLLVLYNCLLPVFFIVAFPMWLIKMWRRGGYGSGLFERLGKFKGDKSAEPQGVVYIHAVSVGEVLIAQKLILEWLKKHEGERIVLAATTSTGHAVAREKSPEGVRVIYSPVDFGFSVRAVFRRFTPRQVILIESEAWPNLLNIARKRGVPVAMVNARLSQRSEARFHKLAGLVQPVFEMVDTFAVQNEGDAKRFEKLGIPAEKISVTGSIKFDPSGGSVPECRAEFASVINDFGKARPVILAASTHSGEEKLIGDALMKSGIDALYLVVPRHAERRATVKSDLESLGYEVCLRSVYKSPRTPSKACLVADTTGELRDWTAHADVVIVGKSWLGKGGQSPAEAIMGGKPVICGPNMANFEPLMTMLRESGGVHMLDSTHELAEMVSSLLIDSSIRETTTTAAKEVLFIHDGAVERTVDLVYLNAFVS